MTFQKVLYNEKYRDSLLELLLKVGVAEYNHGPEWVDYYKTYNFDSLTKLWLVLDGDKVIASGGYKAFPNNCAEIVLFYMYDEYRGHGIASDLYHTCYKELSDSGIQMLFIITHEEFTGYKMWLRYGFVEYGEDTDEFGNPRIYLVRYCL